MNYWKNKIKRDMQNTNSFIFIFNKHEITQVETKIKSRIPRYVFF